MWKAGIRVLSCDQVHEYLNFKGAKLSKSQGAAVDVPYFLSKHAPFILAS